MAEIGGFSYAEIAAAIDMSGPGDASAISPRAVLAARGPAPARRRFERQEADP